MKSESVQSAERCFRGINEKSESDAVIVSFMLSRFIRELAVDNIAAGRDEKTGWSNCNATVL